MPAISPDLLRRFDATGPRYTSYPTADRFVDTFTWEHVQHALVQRQMHKARKPSPLSLYVHIPFCESLCYYCACNKIITRQKSESKKYLNYLSLELQLIVAKLGKGQSVSQLHLGGGTPTFLSDDELRALMALLKRHFEWTSGGEFSVEVDPRTVNAHRLAVLAELGFNRLSLGVQDFDPAVQKAVHRIQPMEQVFELVGEARKLGFESVNTDLIYGLPLQSPASFERTLKQINALRPDRIALYAYAHLPERFKPQRRIHAQELPLPADKVMMLSCAMDALTQAGYVYVGMDHFALPDDALAIAKRQGRLHRNFQGYSTQPDSDLVALGVSAIGRMGLTYSQNAKTMDAYCAALDQGHLPIVRGWALTRDDLLRRSVIMALMCQGNLHFEAFNEAWLIDFKGYFVKELLVLEELQKQGLVALCAASIQVTAVGWFFVRAVAMVFDRYLQADPDRSHFSKIV